MNDLISLLAYLHASIYQHRTVLPATTLTVPTPLGRAVTGSHGIPCSNITPNIRNSRWTIVLGYSVMLHAQICTLTHQRAWILMMHPKPLNFGWAVYFIEEVVESVTKIVCIMVFRINLGHAVCENPTQQNQLWNFIPLSCNIKNYKTLYTPWLCQLAPSGACGAVGSALDWRSKGLVFDPRRARPWEIMVRA